MPASRPGGRPHDCAAVAKYGFRGGGGGGSGKTFFHTLDGIRGVAALLIVLRHADSLFAPIGLQESYLAVDVFFVLSGVVIAQAYGARLRPGPPGADPPVSKMSFRRFAWLRLVRIMPLYWLGTAISVVTIACGLISVGSWRTAAFYTVLALFMIPNPGIGTMNVYPLDNPAWSLPLELAVNAFYARFIGRLTRRAMAGVMAVSMLGIAFTLYRAQSHSLNIGFWVRTFPFGLFRVGYSFFAGVLIFEYYARAPRQRSGRWPTLAVWLLILTVGLLFAASPDHRLQPYFDFAAVVFVFPFIVYLALLVQPVGYSAVACRFLGAVSYAAYTLHAPLIGLAEAIYAWRAHATLARFAPFAGFVFVAVLIPVCVAADRFYDGPVRLALTRPAARRPHGFRLT